MTSERSLGRLVKHVGSEAREWVRTLNPLVRTTVPEEHRSNGQDSHLRRERRHGDQDSQTASTATALTSNSFTRWGYTFDGWATTQGGAKMYPDRGTYPFDETRD